MTTRTGARTSMQQRTDYIQRLTLAALAETGDSGIAPLSHILWHVQATLPELTREKLRSVISNMYVKKMIERKLDQSPQNVTGQRWLYFVQKR